MKLYVNGQDIRQLVLGDVDQKVTHVVKTGPEGYLQAIDAFLRKKNTTWEQLDAIYAIVGPGSATALRSILSILQTVHFVQGTKLYAVEKESEQPDDRCIVSIQKTAKEVERFEPVYQYSPRITHSNKDALGRKTKG